jgi:hypothetical protein
VINFGNGIALLAALLSLANLMVLFGILRRQRRQHRMLERRMAEVGNALARRSAQRRATAGPATPPPIRVVRNDP